MISHISHVVNLVSSPIYFFQCIDIKFRQWIRKYLFVSNYANAHRPSASKGNSHDITAVELFVNNTATNGVAVKTDKKIKKGCTVTDADILWSFYGA